MEWIFLVLIGLVLLFGIAVLVVSRRRAQRSIGAPSAPPRTPPTAPPQVPPAAAGTTVLEEPPVVVEAPEVITAPLSLRERMSRARSALAGAFVGVRGRRGITEETWDELEEALLLADVGVGVTANLLDDLRTRVKAKELTEPDAAPRRPARRHEGPAGRRRPDAALRGRRRRQPERVAVRRRQRRRQDDHHRQGRQPAEGRGPLGTAGCRRHVPGRRRRAARHVGRAGRRRGRARQRGRRSVRPSSSTPSKQPPHARSTSCWPTRPGDCTPRPT